MPWTDAEIVARRPPKPVVDPWRPHGFFVEQECAADGMVRDAATVLLANKECPFRCLMCDLWKYTTDVRTPRGAIPAQLQTALAQLPPTHAIKLYNAGNFFDAQAIPPHDWQAIAALLQSFERVIVECHPRLVGPRCLQFRDLLGGRLEVAMGLETIHPEILPRLNKRMTLADFDKAVQFLRDHDVDVRAFILLRPPWLNEEEGLEWAQRSLLHAMETGVQCCTVIPTRAGNGAMDELQAQGFFAPPTLQSLAMAVEYGMGLGKGRVFADLWDAKALIGCRACDPKRIERLHAMNLTQMVAPPIQCEVCRAA